MMVYVAKTNRLYLKTSQCKLGHIKIINPENLTIEKIINLNFPSNAKSKCVLEKNMNYILLSDENFLYAVLLEEKEKSLKESESEEEEIDAVTGKKKPRKPRAIQEKVNVQEKKYGRYKENNKFSDPNNDDIENECNNELPLNLDNYKNLINDYKIKIQELEKNNEILSKKIEDLLENERNYKLNYENEISDLNQKLLLQNNNSNKELNENSFIEQIDKLNNNIKKKELEFWLLCCERSER